MKKILIIMLALLMVTGCEEKIINEGTVTNKDNVMVEVNGEKFKLSSENNLKDMYYKENYVDFYADAVGKMRTMQYSKNGEFVFEVRLIYEDDRSFDEVKQFIKYEMKEKEINGIKYEYYEYETDVHDKVHVYLRSYKDITYTIMFVLSSDMNEFENVFMNNIYFK